ncbi:MAG TPA: glycosyltransferase family 1 protein [Vicinamibacterales bacterium]|nr:glycosyltransferase family 1 protein [Vicinamibacterales bacterium]
MTGLRAGGPESYDTCLARALARVDRTNGYTVYCVTGEAVGAFAIDQPNFEFRVLRPRSRWVSIPVSLPCALLRHPPDLFHATYVPPPLFPGRLIFTLLDLSMFSHPHLYPPLVRLRLQMLIRSAIRRATRILTISEFSRQCLLDRFHYPEEQVTVTPLGVDPQFQPCAPERVEALLQSYEIREPYILHVGRLQARKNLVRLLEAFARLVDQERIPHKLVLVGRESWEAQEIFEAMDRLQIRSRVIHVGYAPTDALPMFYSGASAVVFPSLFEGFGLPVLEAMACGAPTVTSTVTSLPEVAGDAAVLVDPYSVEDIAAGIYKVLSDRGACEDMKRRGLARAATFTWARTAEQTVDAYRRAMQDTARAGSWPAGLPRPADISEHQRGGERK